MVRGSCFCGEVRYVVRGPVRDARSCHCSRCRKAFSAQASAYALVEAADFEWVSGRELLSEYVSQHGFGLSFCRVCGSTLCGTFNGEVHGITLGCLDDDPEIEIGYHLYVGSKASWERLPEGVVTYPEAPPP